MLGDEKGALNELSSVHAARPRPKELSLFTGGGGGVLALLLRRWSGIALMRAVSIVPPSRIAIMAKNPEAFFGIPILPQPEIDVFASIGAKLAAVFSTIVVDMINGKKLWCCLAAAFAFPAVSGYGIGAQGRFVSLNRLLHLVGTSLITLSDFGVNSVPVFSSPLDLIFTSTLPTISLKRVGGAFVFCKLGSRKFNVASGANFSVRHSAIIPREWELIELNLCQMEAK